MHGIQLSLVASCLCRSPPVTTWIGGRQGPTRRKGCQCWGFRSGRRFAPCLRGGGRGKFSAGRRCSEAGCRSTSQVGNQAAGTRQQRDGVDTPSFHPEVPGIQFVSLGHGLDFRQSVGWTKVCGTTQSGIWVLKGNARTLYVPCQS